MNKPEVIKPAIGPNAISQQNGGCRLSLEEHEGGFGCTQVVDMSKVKHSKM
jgi:hypothetical protein